MVLRQSRTVRLMICAVVALAVAACAPPAPAPSTAPPVKVVAGSGHSCALRADRTVSCWGLDNYGQLGDGRTFPNTNAPQPVRGLTDVIDVVAAQNDVCALRSDRTVLCWGRMTSSAVPQQVAGIDDATALTAGAEHVCALRADRTVACWGDGQLGQLGIGTNVGSSAAQVIPGLTDVTEVAAGLGWHTCALRSDRTVVCWGGNQYGQLGIGTTAEATTPQAVPGLVEVTSLGVGYQHTCVVVADRTARCWGRNDVGQLGNGGPGDSTLPVDVPGLASLVGIHASGYRHTCVLDADRTVRCWGVNYWGQLGNGSFVDDVAPQQVSGLTGVVQMSVGINHACALTADRAAWCWGFAADGQLGSGEWIGRSNTPVRVAGL